MALILCIETSSEFCSVCVAQDGNVLASICSDEKNTHARQLTIFIEKVLLQASVSLQQLDAVAVSSGPGSFTGLRIGVSCAKGICYALGKPLIHISTMQILAAALLKHVPDACYLLPTLKSRTDEFYAALYDSELMAIVKPFVYRKGNPWPEEILPYIGNYTAGGNIPDVDNYEHNRVTFVTYHSITPEAIFMTKIAEQMCQNAVFTDVSAYEPAYIQEFIPKQKSI